jgi:hypothetical protein
MKTHLTAAFVAAIAGSLLVGCGPEYSLGLTSDAHGADIEETLIAIPVGNAIGVQPLEDGDPLEDEEVFVELSSTAPSIMEVAETGDPSEFVLWGRSAGRADVEIIIDGQVEGVVEVEVLPR